MTKLIWCDEHGDSVACMICSHLIDDAGRGYARVHAEPNEGDYETLMCSECELLLVEEQGWSAKLYDFAQWKLLCRVCCTEILKKHTLVADGSLT